MSRRKFSKKEREAVYAKCNGHCAYCGCEISMDQMQVDHKIPIYLEEAYNNFGQDLNDIDNLLPACRSCNHYKDTMNLELFRRMVQEQPEILWRDRSTFRLAVRYGLVKMTPHAVKFYFEKMNEEEAHETTDK